MIEVACTAERQPWASDMRDHANNNMATGCASDALRALGNVVGAADIVVASGNVVVVSDADGHKKSRKGRHKPAGAQHKIRKVSDGVVPPSWP